MEGLREIKRRIRSIHSTQQITRAMNMVAAAKLRKTQHLVTAIEPYVSNIEELIGDITKANGNLGHQFFRQKSEPGRSGIIVITGDRGLTGGHNSNIIKKALEGGDSPVFLCVGRKGRDYFVKRGYDVRAEYIGLPDEPGIRQAKEISENAIELFEGGDISELYVAYTEFITTVERKPHLLRILPIDKNIFMKNGKAGSLFLYEPGVEGVLNKLLPHYVEIQIYRGLVESKVSEFAARMMAMDTATDNADEMIEKLTLDFNRARQAEITQEISEIVGGAEALK